MKRLNIIFLKYIFDNFMRLKSASSLELHCPQYDLLKIGKLSLSIVIILGSDKKI
jgi:hypothetical protein